MTTAAMTSKKSASLVRGLKCRECGSQVEKAPVHVCENCFGPLEVARELGPGKTVVTILCDTGERYFSSDAYFE